METTQPVHFFGLYADILAGVITLDGVNEHYMINSRRRFEEPASNYFQAVERQDPPRDHSSAHHGRAQA